MTSGTIDYFLADLRAHREALPSISRQARTRDRDVDAGSRRRRGRPASDSSQHESSPTWRGSGRASPRHCESACARGSSPAGPRLVVARASCRGVRAEREPEREAIVGGTRSAAGRPLAVAGASPRRTGAVSPSADETGPGRDDTKRCTRTGSTAGASSSINYQRLIQSRCLDVLEADGVRGPGRCSERWRHPGADLDTSELRPEGETAGSSTDLVEPSIAGISSTAQRDRGVLAPGPTRRKRSRVVRDRGRRAAGSEFSYLLPTTASRTERMGARQLLLLWGKGAS